MTSSNMDMEYTPLASTTLFFINCTFNVHMDSILSTELPQKVFETTGLKHDSLILDELADSACIIVADRAYFQIDRSNTFFEEKQHFVIRVKTNVEMSRKKSLKRMSDGNSNVINDYTCQVEMKKRAL